MTGIGQSMSYDLAPMVSAASAYMSTLRTTATTTDQSEPPSGVPTTLASITNEQQGSSVLEQIFNSMHISQWTLNHIVSFLLPSNQTWTDPFGGLMGLGSNPDEHSPARLRRGRSPRLEGRDRRHDGLPGPDLPMGRRGSNRRRPCAGQFPRDTDLCFANGHSCAPGIIIAYVLPMIPYVLWMAGVCGWIILVCEAMVAVPLWMLAHMTFGGEGLHGRGIEGWGLLVQRHVPAGSHGDRPLPQLLRL